MTIINVLYYASLMFYYLEILILTNITAYPYFHNNDSFGSSRNVCYTMKIAFYCKLGGATTNCAELLQIGTVIAKMRHKLLQNDSQQCQNENLNLCLCKFISTLLALILILTSW